MYFLFNEEFCIVWSMSKKWTHMTPLGLLVHFPRITLYGCPSFSKRETVYLSDRPWTGAGVSERDQVEFSNHLKWSYEHSWFHPSVGCPLPLIIPLSYREYSSSAYQTDMSFNFKIWITSNTQPTPVRFEFYGALLLWNQTNQGINLSKDLNDDLLPKVDGRINGRDKL